MRTKDSLDAERPEIYIATVFQVRDAKRLVVQQTYGVAGEASIWREGWVNSPPLPPSLAESHVPLFAGED